MQARGALKSKYPSGFYGNQYNKFDSKSTTLNKDSLFIKKRGKPNIIFYPKIYKRLKITLFVG